MPYKEHKELQKPEMSQVIWHYFSLSKFLYMIDKSTLYFCRNDKYDDSFEGRLSVLDKNFLNRIDPDLHKSLESDTVGCYYSNCWTMSDVDEYVLWNSYSSLKDGVAVCSTVKKLINSLDVEVEKDIYISDVQYIDYSKDYTFRKTDGSVNVLALHYSKRNYFRAEKELRLVYVNHRGSFIDSPDGVDVKVNLSQLIDKVYVAPHSFPWMKDVISQLLEKYGLKNIEVVKSAI